MIHHAFVIEAEPEAGITTALTWAERELGVKSEGNPDVVILRHGLLTVADARKVADATNQAAFVGNTRVIIVTAGSVYYEAQNALLKVFEEPAPGVHLFLVLPSLGGLLPTLRSRVAMLVPDTMPQHTGVSDIARAFIVASRGKRTSLIKKLTSGKDEEMRRADRDEAIALINGIEAAAATHGVVKYRELLEDISMLRGYLYDRSAPVKQILEHVAIVTPTDLV